MSEGGYDIALRHPLQGKAHRPVVLNDKGFGPYVVTACGIGYGPTLLRFPQRLPVDQVPTEDLCAPCWERITFAPMTQDS